MIIYVDVDSTIADLMPVWLDLYNADYNDHLTPDMITAWEIDSFVKPECKLNIYNYLELPDLYDDVKPIDGARSGVKYLRQLGHRVVFASSGVYAPPKYAWLEFNGFDAGVKAEDYIVVHDKSLLRGDLLIDDKPENLTGFGGAGILFHQPWNATANMTGARNWHEVIYMIRNMR